MSEKSSCFSAIADAKINRTDGIISGVSVITIGQAKGHGLLIDRHTLETVQAVASEFPNGVKVKLRHREQGEHQSVLESVIGLIRNFSISGQKLIGNLHLFKSLDEKTKEKVFELAEQMPDQFGLSIDFTGVSETKGNQKFARCQELNSIDLSDKPAANPDGLFSMKSIKYEAGDSGKHAKACECDDCGKPKSMSAEEMATALSAIVKTVQTLADKVETLGKPATVTVLSYKDKDGKEIQLSAEQIATQLSTSTQLAADSKKQADENARTMLIEQMGREGRVAKNPATKIAYKLDELRALPLENLQFAAANSPCLPLEAKAVYRGTEKKSPASNPNLKGTEKVIAALSEKYDDLDILLATPVGQGVN